MGGRGSCRAETCEKIFIRGDCPAKLDSRWTVSQVKGPRPNCAARQEPRPPVCQHDRVTFPMVEGEM